MESRRDEQRVVQYTRTDTSRVIAFSFCTTRSIRTGRETMVYESYSLWELHIITET